MFRLSATPLDSASLKAEMANERAGAFVSFEGWVRNHNEGHAVTRLDYEAYEALCLTEATRILAEARARFDIIEARCVHRTGSLGIGEMAVWVGVTAEHRKAAFEASEFVINEVKSRLPIWKKEFYENGDSGWINCQACASHAHLSAVSESQYYARQQLLKDVGLAGQEKLTNANVLVVGAGGLGCGVLPYLAAAGVGHIILVDDDVVDVSNLHRQVLYTTDDIGQSKALKAVERLRAQNPLVEIVAEQTRVTTETVDRLFAGQDIVLDCTDNFETKFLLNDAAVRLGIPLLLASIYQYEGELQWVSPKHGSACLRCLWPEIPAADCIGSCAEVGVLGAVPGVFGALQAMETLKHLLGLPTPLFGETLYLDLQTLSQRRIRRNPSPGCSVCASIQSESPKNRQDETPIELKVTPELRVGDYHWVDIREPWEYTNTSLENHMEPVPGSETDWQTVVFSTDKPVVLVCQKGYRSRLIAETLRARGMHHVCSLENGMADFSRLLAEVGSA